MHVQSGGNYAGNTLRDLDRALGTSPLHQALHGFRIPLKVELCSWHTVEREQTMVLPHVLFSVMCHEYPEEFQRKMVGPRGAMEQFWTDMVLGDCVMKAIILELLSLDVV